ncbi:pyridoxal 5'-phosphate synthase glutaminase subunit PdxT [soil metagenome]
MSHIGILAVQGAFAAHATVLRALGHAPVLVRAPRDFAALEGLVLPGGESTVQLGLLTDLDLDAPLQAFLASGKPVLATCAGLILLASHVRNPTQRSLGAIDVTVARNAWGRQVDSFEATSEAGAPLVFIRAPRIIEHGAGVEVLDRYRGEPILVRQKNVTGATYHPELTTPHALHDQIFPT